MVSFPAISKKTKDKLILGTLVTTLTVIVWFLSVNFSDLLQLAGTSASGSDLVVSFYDVGQGDSILLERGDTQVLVDGGPGEDVLSYLGQDMSPWDRTIELMVLTHPHADHLTGLISVLERYQVERVLFYPIPYDSERYQQFLEATKEEGAVVLSGEAGTKIEFSGVVLRVLWPRTGFSDKNINNGSVVLAVDYGEFNALLLGDAEREAQVRFTAAVPDVEVVKIAHQGALDGLYETLLRQASPDLAVISVGAGNSYGHPHQAVLELLDKLGIPFLRTDLSGTIRVVSDGNDFWYDTERNSN